MRSVALLLVLTVACTCFGCSDKDEQPGISQVFKDQAKELLKDGSALRAATHIYWHEVLVPQSNYLEASRLYTTAKGSFDLLEACWPEGHLVGTRSHLDRAFQAWELGLYLHRLDIREGDEPVAPNHNRFADFEAFGRDRLIIMVHPDRSEGLGHWIIPDEYKGKEYVSFVSIPLLMENADSEFQAGRDSLLKVLQ
jgi:hypothetical protein